jgi:hypothetical protein
VRSNDYLRDDEYRAITRETVIRSLSGTITFTPAAITVALEPPGSPASRRVRKRHCELRSADMPGPAVRDQHCWDSAV